MQSRGGSSENFRVSVSSAPSSSSQGSGQDESDAVGDVYIWGEGILDGILGGSIDRRHAFTGTDSLLPKPLESALVLDVHHISCGVKHAALVTRQGEVFTWGEDCGGRLGHGVCSDVSQPQLVEALASSTVDYVACGEYHTCAVTTAGDLYTWGDGSHHFGLLGHGNDVSHWIPKKIFGPLDGIQVSSVACGPWHTAIVTSAGQLFTFGLGIFGVLGHGDRSNVRYPKEVDSLKGLKTVAVACGVWHTAAIVEVIVTQSSASSCSGKLFTWGDGDKGRLGHGDKETKLVPTCVSSLIDYNFCQIACGHSVTVALTTSGHIFTMGSAVYGQLGNPQANAKMPCMVEGRLANETVEQIDCGIHHIACLTSRNEVYTWGKGSNGRLGHGDLEDRKTPTLVEALKDKHVKSIACGSSFTAAICLHKWVSGSEQSACSGCKQSFGFTRKRHNCYNCGLQHCHSCSSKKALKAALAPNPSKPYRVCDSCYNKLKKASEIAALPGVNKRAMIPRRFIEGPERFDRLELKTLKPQKPPLEVKSQGKRGKRSESSSAVQTPQMTYLLPLKDMKFSVDSQYAISKSVVSLPQSKNSSRAASPFSRRPSPPRSATPVPTMAGLTSSRDSFDDYRKKNQSLNEDVIKLQEQVEYWKQKYRQKDSELQLTSKKAQEALSMVEAETRRCKAAKEAIKSLNMQLNYMAEIMPGAYDPERLRAMNPNIPVINGTHNSLGINTDESEEAGDTLPIAAGHRPDVSASYGTDDGDASGIIGSRYSHSNSFTSSQDRTEVLEGENGEKEWVEQDEPGVYITLIAFPDGTKELKRVRFSRKKFGERQAETWWQDNRTRIYEKYNVRSS